MIRIPITSLLDSEEDIEIATDTLAKDNQWSRLRALSVKDVKKKLAIVDRLIDREKLKAKIEPDTGFHDDM